MGIYFQANLDFRDDRSYIVGMGRIGHCRQHILDSGTKVLFAKGYNGTGVKQIVDAAGVPKGSFYNHFSSKEAFVVEALEKLSNINMENVQSLLANADDSPKQRLNKFFGDYHQHIESCEFNGGCLFANLCLEMADEVESIRAVTNNHMEKVTKLIEKTLDDAKSQGELEHSVDSLALATFIFNAWEGTVIRMKASRSSSSYEVFKNQLNLYFN
ncbi:MAG: TetR/AcrR family transcriptional regulator [Kangiellaceae bacterium]